MTTMLMGLAALLSAAFGVHMFRRYQSRRAPFYFWWGISFLLYAAAFFMEALTVAHNWRQIWEYQVYIVASAGLVGAMSVGTTHLALGSSKWARGYAFYFVVAEVALLVFTLLFPPTLSGTWQQLNAGQHGIVGPTQVVYILLSAIGGPIVVLGSLWSWWKTRRYYTLLIAAGALVPSMAGTLASQGSTTALFPLLNVVGLILIFLGYIYSKSPAARTHSEPLLVARNRMR